MDTEAHKFHISGEYFQNFPSADIISPEHYVITTNSDTNSLDWNVSSPSHNQSADCHQEIPSELLCFVERLQQEVHSLDKQCREYQLDAEECRLELRNVEQQLELSKQEVAKERDERRKEISLANELRIEIEEKLTCSQGEVVQYERKLESLKKRDQKYKDRNQLLQKSLIEFQEQIKELDSKLRQSDTAVNQLTCDREQLVNELNEANNNAEFLANQNQELEFEVTWHKDELIDTRESLNHLQKEFEFQSLRQTVQNCADEVSLLDEIGHEGALGRPIILQTDPDSADEQTDIPEYLGPQMVPPPKPAGLMETRELEYFEMEVEKISCLEGTVTSLMEQLEAANDECAELHSELFTSRAQVKLQERGSIDLKEKLEVIQLDRERMRNKINKARTKLANAGNEKKMLEARCVSYLESLEKNREDNASMERQLIRLIEQKICLAEQIAAYELDVSCLIKSNLKRKLLTEETKTRKNKWFS